MIVVSANQVPRETEIQARDLLKKAQANIIGVAVNRMSPDNVDSIHFYSRYYADFGTSDARLTDQSSGSA